MRAKEGERIKNGFHLPTGSGGDCVVEAFLGGGGQGEVYRVRMGAESLALKWYHPQAQKNELKQSLEDLIKKGAPNDRFLWPKQVIEYEGQFGYLMHLRPPEYQKSQNLLDRTFSLSYKTAANACLQLSDSFRQLHVMGLAYQDLNWGNLFINPDTGDILICDNDNVAAHGTSVAVVAGTYGFMAPEVVRGECPPDTYTDLFSLAVLMFRILVIDNPFDGRRWVETQAWDNGAKRKFYGDMPVFIFDPDNDENRPVRGEQDNAYLFWGLYPHCIRENFVRVFTEGLHDRENGRLMEEDWIDVFRQLQAGLFPCPCCQVDIAFDWQKGRLEPTVCWNPTCSSGGQPVPVPPRLRIKAGNKERLTVLNPDTKLYYYQMVRNEPDLAKGSRVVAEMAQNPENPNKWGLRNKTADFWQYTTGAGSKEVPPEKSMALNAHIVAIDFKTAKAEIVL